MRGADPGLRLHVPNTGLKGSGCSTQEVIPQTTQPTSPVTHQEGWPVPTALFFSWAVQSHWQGLVGDTGPRGLPLLGALQHSPPCAGMTRGWGGIPAAPSAHRWHNRQSARERDRRKDQREVRTSRTQSRDAVRQENVEQALQGRAFSCQTQERCCCWHRPAVGSGGSLLTRVCRASSLALCRSESIFSMSRGSRNYRKRWLRQPALCHAVPGPAGLQAQPLPGEQS